MVKEPTTKSTPAKTVRKPRAVAAKKTSEKAEASVHHELAEHTSEKQTSTKAAQHLAKGKYIFATGRRKTAIANVRLFSGKGDSVVNKVPVSKYFGYEYHTFSIDRPFDLTGLGKEYHFTAHVSGGGQNAQAEALRHGIALALSEISDDIRRVLKKNGLLTRDDRRKERKKPGLKRARRSPQWSKR